ncbi:MAG TPA: tRNA (adenosine(37)-N6)-dimethylallyltransferase MiaA [Terriglobales bacterium]|nr:tRNA (adenosine(37)-N6)-dimethylallyltransferase MiaA [Terriglobales bacterium]
MPKKLPKKLPRLLKAASLPKLDREPLVVVVLGPTASGKTALALAIARRFHGEIVNCDSVAMYREFEIGTAKPSAAERAEIPHHLLDCVDPRTDISAGEYARQARQVLREIVLRDNVLREDVLRENEQRRRLPIVSGGTGLYLRALLEGLFPGPERSEELRNKLRSRVEKHGPEHLHRILRRLDATAASRIHANDVPKVIRAIEVCLASRQPSRRTSRQTSRQTMTELWRQGREPLGGFRILRLGLNPEREALYARINQRAAKMFDDEVIAGGIVAETETLLKKYGDQARPLKSLGYKQALQFLRGELDRESALAAAQQAHRNYAKRQITWFRQEPDVHWLAGFGDDPAIQAEGIALIEREI